MFTNSEIYGICHLIMEKGRHGAVDPLLEYFINNTISGDDRKRLGGNYSHVLKNTKELMLEGKYSIEIKVTKNKKRGK